MRNERESDGYLPPQEQLLIAAKVNRLCDATVATFDPETQVADAQDIVNALNPRIKPSGRVGGKATITSSSTSEVREGATNAGNISVSFKDRKTKKFEFGVNRYRIGNYIVRKIRWGRITGITFEHFWDRGMTDEAFQEDRQNTRIDYDSKTLEVVKISIWIPRTRQIACLFITTYKVVPLWEKEK